MNTGSQQTLQLEKVKYMHNILNILVLVNIHYIYIYIYYCEVKLYRYLTSNIHVYT